MAKLKKVNGNFVIQDFHLSQMNMMLLEEGETLDVDIKTIDKRKMSEQQRKFIFALVNEISNHTGYEKEYARAIVQQYNATLRECEVESLSTCNMTYANDLIDTIIYFCICYGIPIDGKIIEENGYHFTSQQTYMMCLKRVCAVCGSFADLHHVDHVGMGNDRKKISHVGKRMLPLCRRHHVEAHTMTKDDFINKYHLIPVECDRKLEYFIKKGTLKYYEEEV